MNLTTLQQYLKDTGRYSGKADGLWGVLSDAAILLALTDGPDTALNDLDFQREANILKVQPAAIKAFWKTEANGAGFEQGKPKILPERHVFSKLTSHKWDVTQPDLSYRKWGTKPYPRSQDSRYAMLLQMARLDLDAAFACTSYGAPQILGLHFKTCGYATPFHFAEAMARDEPTQLSAFADFVIANGILPHLQKVDKSVRSWEPVAMRYNGTGFRNSNYHIRMRDAFILYGGR